jgi:uncharacterized glyoxalase superfamily metalloenzyme YdcJ
MTVPASRLRASFAAALSSMYGAEVPAYTTPVEVTTEVNRVHAGSAALGSMARVSAERHGAIRVGSAAELADTADLFAAFGMFPVGFYDLREALVRRVGSGLGGGRRHRRCAHHPHQPPHAPRAGHRRAVCPDDPRGVTMIDAIQGPPRTAGPAVLLRQTPFRALAEPRRFRGPGGAVFDGTLRVRFGEVEARGVALTPAGRERYDAAMADPGRWDAYFPDTDAAMAASGLAYYRGGDPTKPVVYEDFLPASAAGIFLSNLDTDAEPVRASDESGYNLGWMSDAIDHHIHDPYALYEKAAS